MDAKLQSNFSDFLQNVPAFAEFRPADLAILEKAMTVDLYADGYEFIGEARRGENMFLIVEGTVIASHRRSTIRGMDIIERLGPGDLFGLVALIDSRPTWATYRALGPVTAASLPVNAFDLLFTADAPIAHQFQNLIALQLTHDIRACAQQLMAAFTQNPDATQPG